MGVPPGGLIYFMRSFVVYTDGAGAMMVLVSLASKLRVIETTTTTATRKKRQQITENHVKAKGQSQRTKSKVQRREDIRVTLFIGKEVSQSYLKLRIQQFKNVCKRKTTIFFISRQTILPLIRPPIPGS